MSSQKVWFITGTSSGFGKTMAEYRLRQGDKVVATLRKPEAIDDLKSKYPPSDLLIVKLNVDNRQEIVDAFSEAKDTFGRIDVVFNNAAYGIIGEVEGTPEADARALFDTNFWGATNVSLEAVKFFREVNGPKIGGTLLVVSSMVGYAHAPALGVYGASKAALEGITASLMQEIDHEWNIKVTIVEPGSFKTNDAHKGIQLPAPPAYVKSTLPSNVIRSMFRDASKLPGANALDGVKLMHKITEEKTLPVRFVMGKDATAMIKGHSEKVAADVKRYESWSSELDDGLPVM